MNDDERKQRAERILELRTEVWTQQRVGKQFEISGERVRQNISRANYDRLKRGIMAARSGSTSA